MASRLASPILALVIRATIALVTVTAALLGCASKPLPAPAAPPPCPTVASPSSPPPPLEARPAEARRAAGEALDAWHAAAARADEDAYFELFDDEGVFLGTDAAEHWDEKAFRAYAHPHFAKRKAWTFRSQRRALRLSADGAFAWFDEDLDAPSLGPVRGSGVLVRRPAGWRVLHYVLSITVPNDRFDEVKATLGAASEPPSAER